MYFIIEHEDQLNRMSPQETCFIHVIPKNDNYHPNLTSASLIYYNDFKKGYVLVIDHCEGFSLSLDKVQQFLDCHKKIYLFDKKKHSYYINTDNAIDLYFVDLNQRGKHEELDCKTQLHKDFYQSDPEDPELNSIIPISKHYEMCQCYMKKISELVGLETDTEIENRLCNAYKYVESSGLTIKKSVFDNAYKISNERFSINQNTIYNFYNLYNTTGRPTNAFNGVNFLAIPKDASHRSCFVPSNDILVEFDFDAYHLRLIAKLVGFECPKESMHNFLGKIYFQKAELTEEEYTKSKEITFKQLYGGIQKEYADIEFFSLLNKFIDKEWKKYNKFGAVVLATGRTIKKQDGLNKLRLFNYIVQNLETKNNIDRIEELKDYLNGKKTKLVLITYDSFLFDYSVADGKQALVDIKNILERDNMLVKYKYGKNYSF